MVYTLHEMCIRDSPMSGTAALVGAVKAYETYSDTTVSDSVLETAADELVLRCV